MAIYFLKKNTKIVDIIWLLHLAAKFSLDDLMRFCTNMIQQNYTSVFHLQTTTKGLSALRVKSDQARSIEIDEMRKIIPHLHALQKNILSNLADEMEVSLLPVTMTTEQFTDDPVKHQEIVEFSINGTMLMTDIFLSKTTSPLRSNIYVYKKDLYPNTCMYSAMVHFNTCRKTRIQLQPAIQLEPNQTNLIVCNSINTANGVRTQQSNLLDKAEELAPGVSILFPQDDRKYVHSLISKMYFKIAD